MPLRLTTSHSIPILPTNPDYAHTTVACSTVVRHNIWIVYGQYVRAFETHMMVFDTRTLTSTVVDCDLPDIPGYKIHTIASHMGQIYMFWKHQTLDNVKFYQFDTESRIFTEILTMTANCLTKPQIYNNMMYCLDISYSTVHLIKIDLAEKVVKCHVQLNAKPGHRYQQLWCDNDKLYLLGDSRRGRIIFQKDENDQVQVINDGDNRYSKEDRNIWVDNCLITNIAIEKWVAHYLVETFDFDKARWNREFLEQTVHDFRVMSAEKIDDTIYMINRLTDQYDFGYSTTGFCIRLVELKPRLSDVCLLQLLDKLSGEADKKIVDAVLEKMPILSRHKLMNMMETRKDSYFYS